MGSEKSEDASSAMPRTGRSHEPQGLRAEGEENKDKVGQTRNAFTHKEYGPFRKTHHRYLCATPATVSLKPVGRATLDAYPKEAPVLPQTEAVLSSTSA